jgi:uncharacterized protein DUF6328
METEGQRINRELLELLNELRVALPGVQVLLAVPYQARFADVSSFQRGVYFATLAASALASALLIAPSALHRLNFRTPDKRRIVFISNTLVIVGLAVLGLAMSGVMLMIADFLFGTAAGIVAWAFSAAVLVALWSALPLWLRRSTE